VRDEELAAIRAEHGDFIDFSIEDLQAQINECRTHADLHGGNVHATVDRAPVLIDFGRVAITPACLDPITLEVSALTHPDAKLVLGGWPTAQQAQNWHSQAYVDASPIRPFVAQCRAWVGRVVRGDRDRDAMLYAYALRQLKYPATPPEIPINLCQGAANRLLT
jgi:hypothetical protein